ncbi:MAG: hypothetical protein WDN04_16345 [Rhodospirillales bacterium]
MYGDDRLTEQEMLERNKRIPERTQKTLDEMIRKRFDELCCKPVPPSRPEPLHQSEALERLNAE